MKLERSAPLRPQADRASCYGCVEVPRARNIRSLGSRWSKRCLKEGVPLEAGVSITFDEPRVMAIVRRFHCVRGNSLRGLKVVSGLA